MSFVHLHTHSHYSLLDGLPKISELVYAAKEQGMNGIALTDTANMYGAIEFYQEAKKKGLKPIIGSEVYLAPQGINDHSMKEHPYQLVLLAKNEEGYRNLVELTTIAHTTGFFLRPRIDWELLKKHARGLIALSGNSTGHIAKVALTHGIDAAHQLVQEYAAVFEGEVYLELMHKPHQPEQEKVNALFRELHAQHNVPVVATHDVRYIRPEDREAQDVLRCIGQKQLLEETQRSTLRNEDYSFVSEEQMRQWFADIPEAVDTTVMIAEKIDLNIELDTIKLPAYPLPDGITPNQELRRLCELGIQKRYGSTVPEGVHTRLDYELSVIEKTGYASYFLIVQDFINWAKNSGVAVGPGRGSAAGSLVSYLTSITDIDPIPYKLLFERFLNPERVSQPDIDTDFSDVHREDVLRYVEEKYGKDHVAQIITFGTMAARAAIRDVGRVLGLSYGFCDRIAKCIPMFTTLEDAVKTVPEIQELLTSDPDAERLIAIAKKLEGVARHTSIHACAVVITKDPLTTSVPLQYASADDHTMITQYSMKPIESLGLLKMDFLGLKNLTIIEDTLKLVKKSTGIDIDIEHIPLNDAKTFSLLQRAETVGVFQLESAGMRRYLKQLQPTEIEDIIAMVSLYRPGPMEFIPDYIDGKHGRKKIEYIDNRLEPVLGSTYGIAVYQEQVSEIARQLAGFSYGEADMLRKAVAKKIKSLLDEQGEKLISGMVAHGIEKKIAQHIWEFILPFARYGFNRSHAACYAMIAYRTAYLKAHYPAEFMAALLTADYGDTDRIAIEIQHAKEMGLNILPPHINLSEGMFSVVKKSDNTPCDTVRFGLKAIKNVGNHIVDRIVTERMTNGVYISIEDLLSRVKDRDLNRKSMESMIKVGALDLFFDRSQLLGNLDILLQYAKRAQEEHVSGQFNLFSNLAITKQPKLTLPTLPAVSRNALLGYEKALMGVYFSGHPLEEYEPLLRAAGLSIAQAKIDRPEEVVTLTGMVKHVKRILTKNGEIMYFLTLEDTTQEIEVILFPKVAKVAGALCVEEALLRAKGSIESGDDTPKMLANEIIPFVPEKFECEIHIPHSTSAEKLTQARALLSQHPGTYGVTVIMGKKRMHLHERVSLEAYKTLVKLFGHDHVRMVQL
ncbi:MAG: DNA polymerase III subunit alpha [Candidatus Kerfeldbacteria bacterium]|nr:DNA polymerase III subunit alpha [Candidatus Kerfeldbacteria bacterium]